MDLATLLEKHSSELVTSVDALLATVPGTSELRGRLASVLVSLSDALRTGRVELSAWQPFLRVGVDTQRLVDEMLLLQRSICDLVNGAGASVPPADLCIFSDWFATFFARVSNEQHRRFMAMLDAVADPVALRGLDGRWAFASSSARSDVESVDEVVRQLEVDAEHALAGERVRSEVQLPTPDGWRWREQHVAPMRASDGSIEGVIFSSRDVHAKKTAQERLAQELAFREQTLALLGHDLRNPLAAVRGLAALVTYNQDLHPVVLDRVHHIDVAAQRMTEMIEELMDSARNRFRGGLRQSARLDEICRAVVDEMRVSNPQREVRFEVSGEIVGSWDPGRIGQVVTNLLGNALSQGDSRRAVVLLLRDEGEEVAIEVTSAGPPVAKTVASQIFDSFHQGADHDEPGDRELGPYTVRQTVDAHRGRISVRSGRDHNCFIVRLAKSACAGEGGIE